MTLFYSGDPVSPDSVTVSQHACKYQDLESVAAKQNSAFSDFYYLQLCFSYCDMSKCVQWKGAIKKT